MTTPRRPAPADVADYGVIAPHPLTLTDGRPATPGDVISLTSTEAEPLIADGHLVAIETTPKEN